MQLSSFLSLCVAHVAMCIAMIKHSNQISRPCLQRTSDVKTNTFRRIFLREAVQVAERQAA